MNFKSNLSTFQSYKSGGFIKLGHGSTLSDILYGKEIGLGFEFGLRGNKQEGLNNLQITQPAATFNDVDNTVQSYWLFGLNYSL